MKKISNLKGIKVLSRKEQREVNGSINLNGYCRGNRCYISIPNGGEILVGVCDRGACYFY